jgi:hypothetical protein
MGVELALSGGAPSVVRLVVERRYGGHAASAVVALTTGAVILNDAFEGSQLWGELFEVPLMSAMFLAMVWHARRRQAALGETERVAAEQVELLERQEQLLHECLP